MFLCNFIIEYIFSQKSLNFGDLIKFYSDFLNHAKITKPYKILVVDSVARTS